MGNRGPLTKTSPKAQAKQALESGESGFPANSNKNRRLRISLIKLNLININKLSPGDVVELRWIESVYVCYFDDMIIGKVPSNYNHYFPGKQKRMGKIIEVNIANPKVVVEVEL